MLDTELLLYDCQKIVRKLLKMDPIIAHRDIISAEFGQILL